MTSPQTRPRRPVPALRRVLRPLGLTAAALAVTAGVAGCGGSSLGPDLSAAKHDADVANAATTAPNACDLYTQAIAEQVLGKPVKRDHDTRLNPHETQCGYTGPKAFAVAIVGDCDFMTQFTTDPQATPVPGVGDKATADASGLTTCGGKIGLQIDVGIVGSYSGTAATDVEKKQLDLEKQLATSLLQAAS